MRFLTSLSAGLFACALAHGAIAASPGLVSVAGRFPAPGASIEAAAVAAVQKAAPAAASAELGAVQTVELAGGERVLKIPQLHRGLPVARRGVAVTFGADGVARHVVTRLEDDLPALVAPAVSRADAALAAARRTGLRADPAQPLLVIWPTADGNKLAWAVAPAAIPGTPYVPVVILDAATGEVIVHYNASVGLDQASVYPTNPVKSPALAMVTLPVTAGSTTLQNSLVVSQNCIDKHHTISLMGFNVHTCDLVQTAAPDANGDFLTAPGMDTDPEDTFSEISMFHHVNRAYTFFRGFKPTLDVNAGTPIPTISNLRVPQGLASFDLTKLGDPNLPLDPFQNAFFSPANPLFGAVFNISGGAMYFGQGPKKDYSYDGDVIYHEFTHSVVNVTLQLVGTPHMDAFGASQSPGAMNEGLADFFSSAIAGDPDVGEYATQDIAPGTTAIRTLDNKDTCPKDIGGEVHQDSTLFSGALWDARKALSATDQAQFDGAVFTAMNMSATGDLGYEDMAKLITDALTASPLGKPAADALTAAFTAHGVLPKCDRVLEYAGGVLNGPAALQNLWFAPGTQSTGVTSMGWTPGVVQAHYTLPAGSTKLVVDLTTVDVGGGGLGAMGTPFAPKVLVSFDTKPIQFTYGPFKGPAGLKAIDATGTGADVSASVDVPAGATDVYVMIGSSGQLDGAYTALKLTASMGTSTSSSSSSSGGGGAGGGTPTSSSSSSGGTTDTSGGCGCAVPGESPEQTGAALGALGVLGLLAARRRRSA
jgi:MYXO-CTERM domain-containing protein